MNNAAFRQLVEDARVPQSFQHQSHAGQGAKKKKSKGSERYQKMMQFKARQKEREDENQYRDRADERRKESNPDYKTDVAKLVEVDIEKSKYLGGDIEHTHLVKGLDYALLSKMRQDLDAPEQEETPVITKQQDVVQVPQGLKRLPGQQTIPAAQVVATSIESGPASARTQMGKAMLYFLSSTEQSCVRRNPRQRTTATQDKFERLGFEFDLDADKFDVTAEVPVTVSRPRLNWFKAGLGADAEDEHIVSMLPDPLLSKLTTAFTDRKSKKAKKRHRHDEQEVNDAQPAPAVEAQDFDIFEGVGRYDPAESQTSSDAPIVKPKSGGIFDNLRAATKEEEDEMNEASEGSELKALMRSVKGLAAAAEKIEKRKAGTSLAAPDKSFGDYGEAHDFDFEGKNEELSQKRRKKASTKNQQSSDTDGPSPQEP